MNHTGDRTFPEGDLSRLRRAASGDAAAWAELFVPHQPRLRRIIELRLDHRLRHRLSASDVVQETLIDAVRIRPGVADRWRCELLVAVERQTRPHSAADLARDPSAWLRGDRRTLVRPRWIEAGSHRSH